VREEPGPRPLGLQGSSLACLVLGLSFLKVPQFWKPKVGALSQGQGTKGSVRLQGLTDMKAGGLSPFSAYLGQHNHMSVRISGTAVSSSSGPGWLRRSSRVESMKQTQGSDNPERDLFSAQLAQPQGSMHQQDSEHTGLSTKPGPGTSKPQHQWAQDSHKTPGPGMRRAPQQLAPPSRLVPALP
jgi:hypothetical protein